MKTFRLNRLFHPESGRCFGVALDGSFPGGETVRSHLVPETIEALASSGVDALRLTLEQAEWLQRIPGKQRPALVLRADTTNAFAPAEPASRFCRIVSNIVDHALRLDAAALALHILEDPEHPEIATQCLENLQQVQAQGERWCLPLMVELRPKSNADLDQLLEKIRPFTASEGNLISLPTTASASVLFEVLRGTGPLSPAPLIHGNLVDGLEFASTTGGDSGLSGFFFEGPLPLADLRGGWGRHFLEAVHVARFGGDEGD